MGGLRSVLNAGSIKLMGITTRRWRMTASKKHTTNADKIAKVKQVLVVSNWWDSILYNATSTNPNLDDARNVATLKLLVQRYDVFIIGNPSWHEVGWQVKDRLKQYAAEYGKQIVCLRYMGMLGFRWSSDQEGDHMVIGSAGYVSTNGTVTNASLIVKATDGTPLAGPANIFLLDPGIPAVQSLATQNCNAKIDGTTSRNQWDGVFLDEISD